MADKTINMTVFWSLTSTLSVSGAVDSTDVQQQVIDHVNSKITLPTIGSTVQQITLESDGASFMMNLTGEQ